jgi:hypothetical protein
VLRISGGGGRGAGGSALASSNSAALTIRHQTHGCHSWSLDGKTWHATQALALHRGGTIAVINNDVMPQTLLKLSGPKATLVRAHMTHSGATALVGFSAKGTYVFTTKAGEDYMKGIKTTGEDNVLRLVVKVT